MYDERGLEGWMGRTLKSLHSGFVTRRKSLASLLSEGRPALIQQDGGELPVDRSELERWAGVANRGELDRLKLPVTLNFDTEIGDSCFIDDRVAGDIIRRMENFGNAYQWREGRMWLPYSLGIELLGRYPTTMQRLFR